MAGCAAGMMSDDDDAGGRACRPTIARNAMPRSGRLVRDGTNRRFDPGLSSRSDVLDGHRAAPAMQHDDAMTIGRQLRLSEAAFGLLGRPLQVGQLRRLTLEAGRYPGCARRRRSRDRHQHIEGVPGATGFPCKCGLIRFGHQPVSDAEMPDVRLLQFPCPDCADSPLAPLPSRCGP